MKLIQENMRLLLSFIKQFWGASRGNSLHLNCEKFFRHIGKVLKNIPSFKVIKI